MKYVEDAGGGAETSFPLTVTLCSDESYHIVIRLVSNLVPKARPIVLIGPGTEGTRNKLVSQHSDKFADFESAGRTLLEHVFTDNLLHFINSLRITHNQLQ